MLKLIGRILGIVLVSGVGWIIYANVRLQYWDSKARDICARESRVEIYQKVRLTREEFEVMPRVYGRLSAIAPLEISPPTSPTFSRREHHVIRENSPRVWKTVSVLVRKSDGAAVARWVEVSRRGGDAITLDHPSSFACPPREQLHEDIEKVYFYGGNE